MSAGNTRCQSTIRGRRWEGGGLTFWSNEVGAGVELKAVIRLPKTCHLAQAKNSVEAFDLGPGLGCCSILGRRVWSLRDWRIPSGNHDLDHDLDRDLAGI